MTHGKEDIADDGTLPDVLRSTPYQPKAVLS
jgi:hypothetical protein